ncbi:MAG: hypothetical protein O2931_08355 [Planctomycetota bacterium]|nr:hypothetical protein [Planctomycetota bacterium]
MDADQLPPELDKNAHRRSMERLVRDLIRSAKDQKRRTRQRLQGMAGDFVAEPSRGPIQRNGRRCIRWHFWQASRAKHQAITDQIAAIKSCTLNVSDNPAES